jgi:hypothetical protein
MTTDIAERMAVDAASTSGVTAAVVASVEGSIEAGTGALAVERGAALARFLAARATAAASQEDLRGLGRIVSESRLREVRFAGPTGEGVVLVADHELLLALLDRGRTVESTTPALWNVMWRYEERGP